MTRQVRRQPTRSVELRLDIAAPVEAVWKALTDAEELSRWFPLRAEVKPGVGGWIKSWWRDVHQYRSSIAAWEPNRHLREIWGEPPEDAGKGRADTSEAGRSPSPLVVDYYLEGKGGRTVLRLAHSGFAPGAEWDGYYDAVRRGWNFELRGLRHYLEHHRGRPRIVAWSRRKLDLDVEQAWRRLMSAEGILRKGSLDGLGEGDRYSIKAATGDEFAGTVHINARPRDFCGTVEHMNHAFLRVRIDQGCDPADARAEVNLFLSTYGLPQDAVGAFEMRWDAQFARLYA